MTYVRKKGRRFWLPAGLSILAAAVVATVWVTVAAGGSSKSTASTIKIAILSDCQGAFASNYEQDIGGAISALAQYAGVKPKNPNKPSAGWTGGKIGGHPLKLVGIGCSNDKADTAIKETRRLMEQLGADLMIGPLSGDESVAVANYAKQHRNKTFVNGTAGAWDTTAAVKAPNFFRFNGDGIQWNAGIGDLAYKKLHWRKAAIIMDDYSFGYASGAGMIADFCAAGGNIVKRVFPPLNSTDFSSFARQLPAPDKVDGYFWAVGGTGTIPSLKAYEQAYGKLDPKKWIGNLFFSFLGADKTVAPKVVGSYIGGFGTGPGLKTAQAKAYESKVAAIYPGLNGGNYADGFVYNYYNAAWALIQGLQKSGGQLGAKLDAAMPRTLRAGYQVSNGGLVKLDSRRQAIQDQYELQLVKNADGSVGPVVVAYVPGVDQSFGGLFKPSSPPPGRVQPPCKKLKTPWQGKIKVVKNGVITNQILK